MTRRISPWSIALMLGATATIASIENAAAQTPPPPPPPPPMASPAAPAKPLVAPPGVAATVNGQVITVDAVKDMAYKTMGPRVVDSMITNMLIDQEAKKEHQTATNADIDAKIAEIRAQIKTQMPGQTLEQFVAQSGHTMAELRDNLKTRIEVEKLAGKDIKPVTAVHVRHILIRTQNVGAPDPDTKIHTEAEAQQIIDKIQADLKAGKPFSDEAKEYTEDPSGKVNGGDLPIVLPNSPLDPNFLAAALKLKKGEVTPTAVKSVYGLHLIYAESTSADPTPTDKPLYDQALNNYKQQMLSMQIPTYVNTLKSKAKIVNYIASGVTPPAAPAQKPAVKSKSPLKPSQKPAKAAQKPTKAAAK